MPSKQPWGWKVTVHVYGTGPIPSPTQMFEASSRAAEAVDADDFVGVDFKRVNKKPASQEGS